VGDAATAAIVLADEQAMLAFCAEVVRGTGGRVRRTLASVRDRQQAVVAAVTDAMTDPTAARRRRIDVPRAEAEMLRELTRVLAGAEEDRLADCLAAESGPWARLLASVAASHAVAVEQVRALR
jgi:hypothetical protein